MDIKNSFFFPILYAGLLAGGGPKEVADSPPCLASYVFHRGEWIKSISDYYQRTPAETKRILLCVLFKGPAAPRNSFGEVRLDSRPIVLSLAAECNKATNRLSSKKQLFSEIYAPCQSGDIIDAKLRAFIIYLGELECGYLSMISEFLDGAGNLAAALIFDGLIYLNLHGEPTDPSVVALDAFGVVILPS